MTLILGLTGGIASGKSTVAKMFVDRGIPVIDSDLIARNLLKKGTTTYYELLEHFSDDILLTNKEINRKNLGRIIFANSGKRKLLNDIVHPEVLKIVSADIEKYKKCDEKIIVIDVPLLFETDFHQFVDKTVVVYASYNEQISRLISRDVIDKEYAQMKINAQMPLSEKVDLADYVINNSFSILQTKKEFNKILDELEVK